MEKASRMSYVADGRAECERDSDSDCTSSAMHIHPRPQIPEEASPAVTRYTGRFTVSDLPHPRDPPKFNLVPRTPTRPRAEIQHQRSVRRTLPDLQPRLSNTL